jgi:hypothetical protein
MTTSSQPGSATSAAEATNLSAHGFRLLADGEEVFVPSGEIPWFKGLPVEERAMVNSCVREGR